MISIVLLSLVSVFALTLIIVYVSLGSYNARQADSMTQIINVNNGTVPMMQEYEKGSPTNWLDWGILNEESAFRTRYFTVYLNDDMQTESTDTEHIASIDGETALAMAERAVSEGKSVGYIDEYRYRIAKNSEGKNAVIFLDCSEEFEQQRVTTCILAAISVAFSFLITLIFAIFSTRVLKPFEENASKQRQFITDASHELKTPLSIIAANAEVLEYKGGSNEWLSNITGQVSHMGDLINDMLALSKMEEFDGETPIEPVDLSDVVNETVSSFSEVLKQKNINLQMNVEPDIVLNGNRKQLNMLVSVLVENASKYITDSGTLKVSLNRSGKYTVFRIFNTAKIEEGFNLKYLFDRFYRPDSSRTSATGGQGIGLSIAKKITELHNGSISAKRVEDGICFTAELSNHLKTGKKWKLKNL